VPFADSIVEDFPTVHSVVVRMSNKTRLPTNPF
jgi:hypothetical protein